MTRFGGHRDSAVLWAYARGEFAAHEADEIAAHLRACPACARSLDQVRAATALLAPAPVPPLGEAAWRRIDEAVLDRAQGELSRPRSFRGALGSWLDALTIAVPAPALVAAGVILMFAGAVYVFPTRGRVEAAGAVASAPVMPEAAATPAEPVRSPAASVVLALRARSADGKRLGRGARVESGARIETLKYGEAWLALPDGSRAGVLGDAAVTLASVAPRAVAIELERGALLVAASKSKDRSFAVKSRGVEVRVVGTRFLVARNGERTDVAVEEGAVEVASGSRTMRVRAGARVAVHDDGRVVEGRLSEIDRARLESLAPERPKPNGAAPAPGPAVALETSPHPQNDLGPSPTTPIPTPMPASPGPDPFSGTRAARSPQDEPDSASVGEAPPAGRAPAVASGEERHALRRLAEHAQRGAECPRVLERATLYIEEAHLDGAPMNAIIDAMSIQADCLERLGRIGEARRVRVRMTNAGRAGWEPW